MAKPRPLKEKQGDKFSLWIRCTGMIFAVFLISVNWAVAQETAEPNCPVKKLNGIAAQEMMVKGVLMHTELEKVAIEDYTKYTFVHTVRADWNIWVCIQGVEVRDEQPENITLSCTACDY